jgi:hypothetical protein
MKGGTVHLRPHVNLPIATPLTWRATATFGFMRLLASTISVVIGGALFQNELARCGVQTAGTGGPLASVGTIAQAP